MMQLPVYMYFLFISAAAGFILLRPASPLYLKLFPFFLLSSAICEYIGWKMGTHRIPNTLLYNYLSTYEFTFYLLMIRMIIVKKTFKAIILWVACAYPAFCLLNIYLIQGPHTFHSFSYCTGCLLIVLTCIYYVIELFQLPNTINLLKEPAFWICSGLLFFCTVSFPLLGLTNYVYNISPIIIENLKFILNWMNVLLYAMFIIAFMCRIDYRKPAFFRTNG
jgi:hypothetical protein